jgi:hypothetical protein
VTPSGLFNKVYLRYAGSTGISPLVATNEIKLWNDQISKIKPLGVVNLPKNVTKELILYQTQQNVNAKTSRGKYLRITSQNILIEFYMCFHRY